MIGLNEELAAREASGRPVRIGMIGAGQMGVDVVAEVHMMNGIDVVVVADIDRARAREAYRVGMLEDEVVEAGSAEEANAAVAAGKRVLTDDCRVVTDMKQMDVMLETTGVPQVGAKAALRSARTGAIMCNDVELQEPSTVLALRRLQDAWMGGRMDEDALARSMDAMAID